MDSVDRLHVWDFDPLTKNEFRKLLLDVASDIEEKIFLDKGTSKKVNMLREVARRLYYSGEAYREDPEEFYSLHSKPIEIWKKGNIPKIHLDVVEKCWCSLCDLAAPTVDEIDGLLISKRWHKIQDSDRELSILVAKRDSYLFVIDLIKPLLDALWEFAKRRG